MFVKKWNEPCKMVKIYLKKQTGFVPFFINNIPVFFQDFSRNHIDYFSRTPNSHLTLLLPRSQMLFLLTVCTFLIMLVLRIQLLLELNRFPELSRTGCLFPGLSSPGKWLNKISGLSRTHMNPDKTNIIQFPYCSQMFIFAFLEMNHKPLPKIA